MDIVISHLNAWQFLSSTLKSEKDRDILFRVSSRGAAWRSLVDTQSLKTQGASLALLQKLDSVRIGTNDDPTLKLLEMDDCYRGEPWVLQLRVPMILVRLNKGSCH